MNNDNNNQSGNSRTTFNAYNEQKNNAKNAMLGKGLDVASRFVPGGSVAKKAINTVAKNPMANAALQNAISRNKNNEDVDGEGENNQPNSSPISDTAKVGIDAAKATAKDAIKKKIFIAIAPYILPALGIFAILLVVVVIAAYAYQNINEVADLAIKSEESALNFITGNGLQDNYQAALEKINQASKDFSGLDKGILIATLNDSIFVSPSLYDEDYVEQADENDIYDASKNFIASKYSLHSFYNVKRDLIGQGTGDLGSALNSIIGMDINVECVPKSKLSETQNVKVLASYAYEGMLAAKDAVVTETVDGLGNSIRTIFFGSIQVNYWNQGTDFGWKEAREGVNFINNLPSEAIRKDWNNVKAAAAECKLKYETDANGNPILTKPLEAQYTAVEKQNDYEKYYNYIKTVYVPVLYMSTWTKMDAEAKSRLVNEVWSDIVNSRNDYYASRDIGNNLSYSFDADGNIFANATISYEGFYMGSVPTSEVAQAALVWSQGGSAPWAGDHIGTKTIGEVGCFATSVAKLIAISGTQILTDTFDPGLFVKVVKANGGFSNNSFNGYGWSSIAPNFVRVNWVGLDNRSMSTYAGTLSDYIKSTMASRGYAGAGYYYVFLVNYTKANGDAGTHFIAIVGENENGELVASDPGNGKVYSIENFSSNTNYRNARLGGISVYYASDVADGSASRGGA